MTIFLLKKELYNMKNIQICFSIREFCISYQKLMTKMQNTNTLLNWIYISGYESVFFSKVLWEFICFGIQLIKLIQMTIGVLVIAEQESGPYFTWYCFARAQLHLLLYFQKKNSYSWIWGGGGCHTPIKITSYR